MGTPRVEITANPQGMRRASEDLELAAGRCMRVAEAISAIDTSGWTTQTAKSYEERMDVAPERWVTMAQAFRRAADASDHFAFQVETVKRQLADATQEAQYLRNHQAGLDPEDPGAHMIQRKVEEADDSIRAAERKFNAAADVYAQEIRSAARLAPPPPSMWEYVKRAGIGAKEVFWDGLLKPVYTSVKKGFNSEFPDTELLGFGMFAIGFVDLWNALKADPWGTVKAIGSSFVDPFYDNPGFATGEFLTGFIPGAGTSAKVGTVAAKSSRKIGGVRPSGSGPRVVPRPKDFDTTGTTKAGQGAAAGVVAPKVGGKVTPKKPAPHPARVNKNNPASFRHEPGVTFKPVQTVDTNHNSFNPHGHIDYKASLEHPTGPKSFEGTKLKTTDGRDFKAEDWPNLTARDLQNIYDYTLEDFAGFSEAEAPTSYKAMNGAVRGEGDVKLDISNAIRNLNATLEKIPPKPGTYYRVLRGFPNWQTVFASGEIFTESFMSTSDRFLDSFYKEALTHAKRSAESPVLKMVVHSESGRHLPVTAVPGENEVLHPAGTRFRVNSIEKISDNPPEYLIDVTEVS